MATHLGDLSLDSIDGTTLRGSFRSRHDKNVHRASRDWGAMMLYDAFSSLAGLARAESELLTHVRSVEFTQPNTASTEFTVEVDDPAILTGLSPGAWDSYYLG
jgi:hypothetical protein